MRMILKEQKHLVNQAPKRALRILKVGSNGYLTRMALDQVGWMIREKFGVQQVKGVGHTEDRIGMYRILMMALIPMYIQADVDDEYASCKPSKILF